MVFTVEVRFISPAKAIRANRLQLDSQAPVRPCEKTRNGVGISTRRMAKRSFRERLMVGTERTLQVFGVEEGVYISSVPFSYLHTELMEANMGSSFDNSIKLHQMDCLK
jgi:hypothetical protein